MDKKVYNKPSLKLEIFTPNEYIASCWFIAEGDCYKRIYRGNQGDNVKYNNAYYIHDTHSNVPSEGHFKTEGEGDNVAQYYEHTATNWYAYDGGNWGNGNKKLGSEGFTIIEKYYEYIDGNVTHYFKTINETNAAS